MILDAVQHNNPPNVSKKYFMIYDDTTANILIFDTDAIKIF